MARTRGVVRVLVGLGGAGLVVAAVALVPAAPASAGPAVGAPRPTSLSPVLLRADSTTWVRTWWTTGYPVCDFRLTATGGDGVVVSYPSNTATYTSFYRGAALGSFRTDYTALRVTALRGPAARLRLTASYVVRPLHGPGGACDGDEVERTFDVRLAVAGA